MADKKFIEEVIKSHNGYRKTHQASDLEHSKDLSKHAQKWAEHLVAINGFQHSDCDVKGERVGENIAMKWSSQPNSYTGNTSSSCPWLIIPYRSHLHILVAYQYDDCRFQTPRLAFKGISIINNIMTYIINTTITNTITIAIIITNNIG